MRHRRVGRAEGGGADAPGWPRPSSRARMARALTLPVLPWSVPMPSRGVALGVLDRAIALARGERRCRRRSRRSGCRRSACRARRAARGTSHSGAQRRRRFCGRGARRRRSPAPKPAARGGGEAGGAAVGEAVGERRSSPRPRRPSARAWTDVPGTKAALSLVVDERGRRDCEKRCTVGFQPPETQSRSQAMVLAVPATLAPSAASGATVTSRSAWPPAAAITAWPRQHLDAATAALRGERHRGVARVDDGGERDAGIGESMPPPHRRCRCW